MGGTSVGVEADSVAFVVGVAGALVGLGLGTGELVGSGLGGSCVDVG